MSFFVHDPFTREPYSRDPRNVARKAENYLASTGIADTAIGAEAEFYIFDSVAIILNINGTFYDRSTPRPGYWNSGNATELDVSSPNRANACSPRAATSRWHRTTTTSTCATR